jgi:hypothetical protein
MDNIEVNTDTPSVETIEAESTDIGQQANEVESVAVEAPVVEEFTPSYKYKAYGKEFEMDEWARPLLNKDTQPHLTKLFEKAGGFEPLKERYESTTQELGTFRQAYSELDGARNKIVDSIEKGDLKTVFSMLGVNNDQIKDFVKQQLLYEGMSPEEKRAIDERNQLTQAQQLYQEQLRHQQSYTESLIMEKHEMEIKYAFDNPRFAPLIESYNQRTGDNNAFRAVVDRIGAYEFNVNGRNISVMDAMDQAVKMLGLDTHQMQSSSPMISNQMNHSKPQPKPIVVPNGASSSSPVKKRAMSIEDLEKEYKQLTN